MGSASVWVKWVNQSITSKNPQQNMNVYVFALKSFSIMCGFDSPTFYIYGINQIV